MFDLTLNLSLDLKRLKMICQACDYLSGLNDTQYYRICGSKIEYAALAN